MGVECRHGEGQGTVEIIPEPLRWNRKRVGMDGVRQGDLDLRQSEQLRSLIGHRDVEHIAARVALRFGSHREMGGSKPNETDSLSCSRASLPVMSSVAKTGSRRQARELPRDSISPLYSA